LVVFGIAIAVLAVVALVLVLLTGENGGDLLDEASPEGTVQRYLMAIQQSDWQEAYAYISPESFPKTDSYEEWLRSVPPASDQSIWKATLGSITRNGNTASVEVMIDTFRPSSPFENPVRSQEITFQLSQTSGKWLIVSPTFVYWVY
jgi:hypothetical protein